MSETFADKVKALDLPLDQIIVIGSGILDQLGIRPAVDIDLAVSSDLMKKLSEESSDWIKKFDDNQRFYFIKDDGSAEVWDGWEFDGQVVSYDGLLDYVVEYDGVRFVNLEFLSRWKKWRSLEKDTQDVKLIDEWRANNE
ncbi:hypothetical protein [Candidatus Nanosynbacter sp. HMT-352]|jgi:hypothetical protein|uniref:hypothetical protein n=1 Tax=Candidatus Nanosynbacter sp. HMT-352 TaxID=2899133 RepID=UPI001E5CF76D|nr:hypothetical protein [Candidatus Nanosynbacter sp. HMT-352]UHA57495.1 hypothetical protein LR957_00645 [Candidatus Nanosynbacter sp. HMT-352]